VIGRLRHFYVIEAPEESDDGAGGVSIAWVPVGAAWARIAPLIAGEGLARDREMATRRWCITLRYRTDVIPACRFSCEGRRFAIESVVDRDGRRRFLVCDCSEEEGS
jgi:SPP1 family predicted phage head-tail adaptor